MRTSLLPASTFLALSLAFAAGQALTACGGKAIEYVGDAGPGGSSGGGSGGTGSSSGATGSSSGVTSSSSSGVTGSSSGSGSSSGGISGSSSGAPIPCPPGPPSGSCDYDGWTCNYSGNGGCQDETCTCQNGDWECAVEICSPPPPECPQNPPNPGETCSIPGESCGWSNFGCGSTDCTCEGGYWQCTGTGCPPPSECPPAPPGNGDVCSSIGSVCDYPINNNVCNTWECDCYPSGNYGCYETNCGGEDAGIGFTDAGGI